MTPTGQVTLFSTPLSTSFNILDIYDPVDNGIVTGPDGALWFTAKSHGRDGSAIGVIGRITTSGSMTFFTDPKNTIVNPEQITVGSDGALWFADHAIDTANIADDGVGWIGRITTSGQVTAYTPPGLFLQNGVAEGTTPYTPMGITTGPDGNLWFASAWVGDTFLSPSWSIDRMTPP